MQQKKYRFSRALMILVLILASLAALISCANKISKVLAEQIQATLVDVARQNKLVIETEIMDKQKLLESIAGDLKNTYKDNKLIVEHLQSHTSVYGFKRMGYIDAKGNAYTTDGYEYNFGYEDHFKAGMNGQSYISGVIQDLIGVSENINVITVPVYSSEDKVEGVIFAVYQTSRLRKLLDVKSFDGEGSTLVITNDGKLIAVTGKDAVGEDMDIFDYIGTMNGDNSELIKELKTDLKQGRERQFMAEGDTDRYMYFQPLDFEVEGKTAYILTILPESVFDNRIASVWYHLERFIIIMLIVLVEAFVFTIYSYLKQGKQVIDLAYSDKVTGGKNYAYFVQRLKARKNKNGYIIAMDIDEFRIINSVCGVQMGDELLKRIWKVIKKNINRTECHARVNADRFIIFFESDKKDIISMRIDDITEQILNVEKEMGIPKVRPYFGVYSVDNFDNIESFYGYANQAKHIVKGNHKENLCFYEDGNYQDRIERKKLEDGFEGAIANREFEVWYQPKFSTKDDEVVSAEALVRWRGADGNLISPGKFIPIFEKKGMIAKLDEYVFDEVCRRQKKWYDEGRKLRPVSVNLSRASLYYDNIAEKYRKIVDSYGLDVNLLQIEITESATVENEDIHNIIDQFHKQGFTLLLDDFGTGYSSLATLNQLEFDVLKVDKSLVDYIGDLKGETLLVHVVQLAQTLGLKVTAEGVETKKQLDFLKMLECDDIQGFYFSKPLPNTEYEVMLV